MSSLYWADLPIQIENSSRKIGIPDRTVFICLELVSAQIFGMLLYMINIDLSSILSQPIPVIVQLIFNFFLFKLVVALVARFDFPPLPSFTDKRHGQLVKSLLFPYAGMLLLLSGGFVVLAVSEQYAIGVSIEWSPLFYAYVANSLLMIGLESFVRFGKSSKSSLAYLVASILLLFLILLTLGFFYLHH